MVKRKQEMPDVHQPDLWVAGAAAEKVGVPLLPSPDPAAAEGEPPGNSCSSFSLGFRKPGGYFLSQDLIKWQIRWNISETPLDVSLITLWEGGRSFVFVF